MSEPAIPKDSQRRDEGSILTIALIFMVLGSLVVGSLAAYASTVLRVNHVVTDRTKRTEAVKAGLRMAMANPRDLYEYCGPDNSGTYNWVTLAPVEVNGVTINTQCHTIDVASSQSDDERRFGLVSTGLGETIPVELTPADVNLADPEMPPTRFDLSDATDTHAWLPETTETSVTSKIWRPRLPSHGVNPRSASGTKMPPGWPECRIFFPGTYYDPVLIDSRTFFTSGVYYFESEVRVIGGADVVVGDGTAPACYDAALDRSISTQDALYYAETVPGEHYVNGYGATFVFGSRGRLVISNDPTERNRAGSAVGEKPISFIVNRRYNKEGDYKFLPSSDVSIITVDGELWDHDNDDATAMIGRDLDAPGRVFVEQSIVGADDPSTDGDDGQIATSATSGYIPSIFTPKLRQPEAPGRPTVAARGSGRVLATWDAPVWDGGAPIVRYDVVPSSGTGCTTNGARSCLITGLPTSALNFTVIAYNHSDPDDPEREVASPPSPPSASITLTGTYTLNPPSAPAAPQVAVQYDPLTVDTDPANSLRVHVKWSPPGNDGGAPITSYTVTLRQTLPTAADRTCTFDMTDAWTTESGAAYPSANDLFCDFPISAGTGPTDEYVVPRFTASVTATNVIGTSSASANGSPAGEPAAGWGKNRVDMPASCDNPVTYNAADPATNEYVAPDGIVSDAELLAWIKGSPAPTACTYPTGWYTSAPRYPFAVGPAAANTLVIQFTPANYAEHVDHPVPDRIGQAPPGIIDVRLVDKASGDMPPVNVYIPSYSSLAQGRIHVDNPEAMDVRIVGGVMAAMFDIDDARVEYGPGGEPVGGTVSIGYEAAAIQRKLEIVSTTATTPASRSTAVVQINQNGAYAVNSWHIG